MPAPKDPIKYKEWKNKLSKRLKGKSKPLRSQEHKKNLSKSLKGKKKIPQTKTHRKNLSIAKKGQTPWNKGQHLSKEHIANISKSEKGKITAEETKEILRNLRLGISWGKHTKESKAKISKSHKGEGNPSWKGGISSENEKARKNSRFKEWREKVFRRDNYTCQKTKIKGGELHPHHIKNFAEYPELRYKVENGITLSKQAHDNFHKIYGKKNNTREQLNEFLTIN